MGRPFFVTAATMSSGSALSTRGSRVVLSGSAREEDVLFPAVEGFSRIVEKAMNPKARMSHLLAIALAATVWLPANAQERHPNLVVIVADDMGYGDVGFQGGKDIPTPNIDELARSGIRFTDAYVSGPYCSPTRAGLLTGRYPQRFGHEFNIGGREMHPDAGLPVDQVTLADRLRATGYRTALVGKWHLGTADRFHPQRRGFDEFYGFLGGAHAYTDVPVLDGDSSVALTGYLTDLLADRAVDFIQRHRSQPFFLYLAFNAPHLPMEATDKYLTRFQHMADTTRRTYAAMLSAMDDGVGRVRAELRAQGLEEKTLVVFFSDNGGPTTQAGINGSSNAPLRGSKRQTWEGGIRVPFVISWKGRLAANTTFSQPVIQLDIAPTVLAAARVPRGSTATFDGVDLLPFLTGRAKGTPHPALYWRLGAMMAIRMGDWKLVKMHDRPFEGDPEELSDLTGAQLYNLKDDVGERNDVAGAQRAKVKELAEDWQRWNRQLHKPAWPSGLNLTRSPNRNKRGL
jgi:arylsulfatase A-like enzyme